ncbi:hypothetical protein F0L68_10525 [Solihabitans fulvus]|uniref:Uncharacterized protein n=1 Tax=Solihabitans fulvus TaxID=1892852 RepID=A0A5B2XJ39_9PSEU|nr:hypothetical protein [Solihabitans fulvus]KAA2263244.1 hypothetical protein F0L68_10525 [Solihabitans fulvus]
MRYIWWQSGYDDRCHAFPANQTTETDRGYYEAACDHSVPPGRVIREQGGQLCTACLILVGLDLPEDKWR